MPMPSVTAPEAQLFRSGLGVDRGRTSLPVIVPAHAAATDVRQEPVTSQWLTRGRLDSDHDAMVSSTSSEKRPTRKERARRHLVGYIGKKVTSPAVTRSHSTNVADRKRSPERVRPRRQDLGSPGRRRDVIDISLPNFRRPAHPPEEGGEWEDEEEVVLAVGPRGNGHRQIRWTSSTTKQSGDGGSSALPELMLQLNSSMRRLDQGRYEERARSPSLDSDMECDVNDMLDNLAIHWDRNRRSKRMRDNPCVTWHRPLTPSLMERLDKMRLSSRTKTERWVSQLPTDKHATRGALYRLGQVTAASTRQGHVDPASQEWLYHDSSLSNHRSVGHD